MKAKLVVEGKEFDIEISDPKLQELIVPKKRTGYERVAENEDYYSDDFICDDIWTICEKNDWDDKKIYEIANYYSNKTVARNNARADTLMRRLRRFAVEHREEESDWENPHKLKATIAYDHGGYGEKMYISDFYSNSIAGAIYFDTAEAAQLAIDTFHDELIWYFTKYKDSL